MPQYERSETGGLTIIYFCLGDKWQDWQERGFANRTASIALELVNHPRIKRLIIVNNPTSYTAVLTNKVRNTCEAFEARKGLRKRSRYRNDIDVKLDRRSGKSRKINMHGIHGYFIDSVKDGVTVVEQMRLFPKERSNSVVFALNNIIHDADVIRILQDCLVKEEDSPLVLWINSPVFAKFAGSFGEDLLAYDARDDWIYHPQLKPIKNALLNGYKRVYKKADIVFAVSKPLVETFSGGRPDVVLVPNGIDSGLFDGNSAVVPVACEKQAKFCNEFIDLRQPVVGYVGKMQDRFDVDLMIDVAAGMPRINFVLVGPVFTPALFEPLKKLANVFFTGRMHQMQMPAIINSFDVCIMPHVKDKLTAAMNPIKLYEYLAFGKPTICTNASDLEQFNGLVEIADDPKEFRVKIHAALKEPVEIKSARMEFAKKQQWSKRVNSMVKEIDRKLFEKASKR